jgi:hypothetical protein
MTALASVGSVFLAAPVGFIVGVLFGLLISNRYRLVNRERYRIVPRDYNNERGADDDD